MSKAYLVATLRESSPGHFEITEVSITSDEAWNLTRIGDGAIHTQLLPAAEGANFSEARDDMRKSAKLAFRKLEHLFRF